MISIIMPFKDESQYLLKTMNSIFKQTEVDFEIIAVDDHSNDNSYTILTNLAKNHLNLHVYKNPGTGIIDALRYAVTKVKGKFITRQDADDLMPDKKLKELLGLLKSSGPGHLATGLVEYFSDNELQGGFIKYAQWLNQLCKNKSHYQQLFKECVVASSNWMLYTKDFHLLKGYSDSLYPEDYHFVFKLYQYNFKIISSDKITHLWRDHQARASRNLEQYKDQKFFDLKVSYFLKFFGKQKICLWGAGPTGKNLAKVLLFHRIDFHWVTNNEKKIGKIIYGVEVFHYFTLEKKSDSHLIISVTQKNALHSIVSYLDKINLINFQEF